MQPIRITNRDGLILDAVDISKAIAVADQLKANGYFTYFEAQGLDGLYFECTRGEIKKASSKNTRVIDVNDGV